MSLSALLTAVRNHLRAEMPLEDYECDCELDGQPQPNFGQRFIAVHPVGWMPGDSRPDYGIDELYQITCTITYRLTHVPQDRVPEKIFLESLTGMEGLARQIVALIHQNYEVMAAANAQISGADKLIQPLFWAGCAMPPQVKLGEWVWSDDPNTISKPAALVLAVRFREARRVQAYARME